MSNPSLNNNRSNLGRTPLFSSGLFLDMSRFKGGFTSLQYVQSREYLIYTATVDINFKNTAL